MSILKKLGNVFGKEVGKEEVMGEEDYRGVNIHMHAYSLKLYTDDNGHLQAKLSLGGMFPFKEEELKMCGYVDVAGAPHVANNVSLVHRNLKKKAKEIGGTEIFISDREFYKDGSIEMCGYVYRKTTQLSLF